jgi:hypothetical protein
VIEASEGMNEAPANSAGLGAVAGMGMSERGDEGECKGEPGVFHAPRLKRVWLKCEPRKTQSFRGRRIRRLLHPARYSCLVGIRGYPCASRSESGFATTLFAAIFLSFSSLAGL